MEQLPDPGSDHIVAEVTKNWGDTVPKTEIRFGGSVNGEPDTISTRLEYVWQANELRGFELVDWKLSTVISPDGKGITETVVAMFQRKRTQQSTFEEELNHITRGGRPTTEEPEV